MPSLLKHQVEAAQRIAASPREYGTVLADEPGLGKTATAIAAALVAEPVAPWLVVAPRNVKHGWTEELATWAPGKRNVDVHHYEELHKFDLDRWKGHGVLFIDEAHYLKNTNTDRFRAVYPIATRNPRRLVIPMTGTPVYSYPVDLFALLAVSRLVTLDQEAVFRSRYCDPTRRYLPGVGERMDYRGAGHLDELSTLLSPYLIRRTWDQVGLSMPPLVFSELSCEPPKGGDYTRAAADFNAWYSKERGRVAPPLARFTVLRRLLAWAKLPTLAEALSYDLRNPKLKVLVFSEFRDPLEALHTRLAGKSYLALGGDTDRGRMSTVEAFKRHEGSAVMLATTGALGVGVNIQEASRVYFLDFGFEPSKFEQAFRRSWRMGQTKGVSVVRCYCEGDKLEAFVLSNLLKKETYMKMLGVGSSTSMSSSWGRS